LAFIIHVNNYCEMNPRLFVVPVKWCARIAAAVVSLFTIGCTAPPLPQPGSPPVPEIGPTTQVVPGPGIPADAPLMQSINNLDVVEFDGSRYLAVRTSLTHFASELTKMIVFRSDDAGINWATEVVVDRDLDVREPRFLVLNGRLFLYFFEAGTNPLAFEPGRILAMNRETNGSWTTPKVISPDDYVVWRTKTVDGVPYMVRYRGGEDSYKPGEASIDVELLTTDDGYDWRPVNPDRPVVHTGGAGETDFAFAVDGKLWAIMRNEAGENGTFGSLLCSAPPDDITNWTCTSDPRKFDSPLVFSHNGDVWILARRQVANEGRYDLGASWLPRDGQLLVNQAAYWFTPKRLALWKVDTQANKVDWVVDLPSRGDTAFPGIVWTGPNSLLVYNYSSPPGDDSIAWVAGQLGPTNIYVTPITFPSP